ncbi:MAG TPA: hypothetical protein VHT05_03400 [Candidatus Elarobacter sp.]|nr:hypothetical protein [Candidatus Elarobacter sp.]
MVRGFDTPAEDAWFAPRDLELRAMFEDRDPYDSTILASGMPGKPNGPGGDGGGDTGGDDDEGDEEDGEE